MDFYVKLLADYVWETEDNITGFLSVVVDIYDCIYLKERPISFSIVQISTKNEDMRNEDNWENLANRNMRFFDEWPKYHVWLSPPM